MSQFYSLNHDCVGKQFSLKKKPKLLYPKLVPKVSSGTSLDHQPKTEQI